MLTNSLKYRKQLPVTKDNCTSQVNSVKVEKGGSGVTGPWHDHANLPRSGG